MEVIGDLDKNCFGRVMEWVLKKEWKQKLETVSAALYEICYKGNRENGAADGRSSGGSGEFFCFVLR